MTAKPKIRVKPEGREDCWWVTDRPSLVAWIEAQGFEAIHNYPQPVAGILIGCDHQVDSVLADIERANRIAITTGQARQDNMNHALAVIVPVGEDREKLELFDIGDVTEAEFYIEADG